MLDFYAIRAQQHAWFVEFVKNWDPKKNLAQLPNIAYSLALATFYSGNSAGKNNSTENANLEADEKLQRALIDFPGKYVPCSSNVNLEIGLAQKIFRYTDPFPLRSTHTIKIFFCMFYNGHQCHL